MEGQSSSGNSQHQYQSAQWSRLVRRNTVADAGPISPPSIAVSTHLPSQPQPQSQVDLFPILLPQHSSYHQAQLAQYNRLITSGRAVRLLQTSPLPPLLSAQHIQAVPGSRSGSTGGNTARNSKSAGGGGHGNRASQKSSNGERALMNEKDKVDKMPPKKLELSNQLPNRPHAQHHNTNLTQQSSSVPSTPHQHPRKFSFSREPSPSATNGHSPRSAYSESNVNLNSSRTIPPAKGRCRYETAMAHTKRRIPYSIGSDKLEQLKPADIKSKLSEDEERKLSTDMRELYDRLLPTPESERKREVLVQKLEKLFNDEWPGHNIRVHMFGSSGNLLCTDSSDVDICITTDWKEMEGVCIIAELLARSGMTNVICVSTAKVPIVKIWDPELKLACDMNVNNTLALENTRMIKTYVQVDPRVRPLAMIIKHWTKQRIVNDAAFGGTLSSYTWICMIINFLQSRSPPVLPALHQRPHMKLPAKNGVESTFADDLKALQGFGQKNKETLGELLFHFFRFYGHEFDYENLVISVRSGKQVSKVDKGWARSNNNRLCVEEPFNVGRNLGNTADDTSFRGLHIELRRAFDLVSQASLENCCEQFVFPKEEEKPVFERQPRGPKPVIRSASQSNRGGRGGTHRGGRHNNQHNRNGNSNRRASSAGFDNNPAYLPNLPNLSAQDVWIQRQAQAQLHNDLYTTYSVLQAQENSLRLQLYAQSLHNQTYAQSQGQGQLSSSSSTKQQTVERNRTTSFDQGPLTAPIRQDMYFYPVQYQPSPMYGYQTSNTNPSSPSLSAAIPELRRSMHRSSGTNGVGMNGGQPNSSLRSHSQPAVRSGPSQLQAAGIVNPGLGIYQSMRQANGVPNFMADENLEPGFGSSASAVTTPPEELVPKEYVGYYVNDHAPSPARREAPQSMVIPSFGDLNQNRRRLSTDQLPQSILDRLRRPSRSPSPLGHDRPSSGGAHSAPGFPGFPQQQNLCGTKLRTMNNQAPLVVNGSNATLVSIPNWQASVSEDSVPDDRGSDTVFGSVDSLSQTSGRESDTANDPDVSGQRTPKEIHPEAPPMVVNGSSPSKPEVASIQNGSVSHAVNGVVNGASNGLVPAELSGFARLSPTSRNRLARQAQNGGMSPLDIGLSQNDTARDEFPHLSPVYETRTPSPTANRKFEPVTDHRVNGFASQVTGGKLESSKSGSKLAAINGSHGKLAPEVQKPNGHTRASKSEGAGPGSWQKISKGKKKGPPAELKSAANGNPFVEKPPVNDNDRKGG